MQIRSNPGVLVAVAAHADDAEINAGGLLAGWAAAGGTIHIVMVTNNCAGGMVPHGDDRTERFCLPPLATSLVRHREQEKAAALIGAKVHHLNYWQRHYWDGQRQVYLDFGSPAQREGLPDLPPLLIAFRQQEHVQRLADLLVDLKPDLVITQNVIDIDPEHHACASMTWQAMNRRQDQLRGVPLWFWSPGSSCVGGMFDPGYEEIHDISSHMDDKRRLFACHTSQVTDIRLRMMEEHALSFGQRVGVRYAEPYKAARFDQTR